MAKYKWDVDVGAGHMIVEARTITAALNKAVEKIIESKW